MTIYSKLPASLGLPRNLADWVGERGLMTLVLDAVQQVQWESSKKPLQLPAPAQPQMLLSLLTYCYAAGYYGSQDISEAIQTNRMVRYICAHHYPDWQLLRKFRRTHRAELEKCLHWVLQQAWARRLDAAETSYFGYDWFEQNLEPELTAAVQNRLELAILMDGVESE